MDSFKKVNIIEYRNWSFSEKIDGVASEKRLRIFSDNKEIVSLLCTPTMVRELVLGFSLSEGLLKNSGDSSLTWCAERIEIFWKEEEIDVYLPVKVSETEATLTSGCAKGVTFISDKISPFLLNGSKGGLDALKININTIFKLFKEFQERSELFLSTGGVHSAALCDKMEIIALAEDIGRHNAVDKIIGYAFLENISMEDKILLLSGRTSSEIVLKAIKAGVPVLVSRAAPTDMAVRIARESKITMIGFLRGQRLNIYSQPERIIT